MHILGTYVHIQSNIKFLSLILWLGELCTDANDADANVNNTSADDNDNYAQWTNHDYIGLFGIIPNEPKNQMLVIAYISKV